jgi:hypothetical protein
MHPTCSSRLGIPATSDLRSQLWCRVSKRECKLVVENGNVGDFLECGFFASVLDVDSGGPIVASVVWI